jgi:predicted NBD/HSP70 family sugar kinase
MLGLELLDAAVIAVAVDEEGRVTARAEVSNPDVARAAAAAAAKVSGSGNTHLCVASVNPESAAAVDALKALTKRFPAASVRALAAGTAAAAAEAWVGAGKGFAGLVYFAVSEHATAGILRNGAPVTGSKGRAASAAWLALNPVEREDYRKIGCLEAEVAGPGIVRRLIWRIKAGDRSSVSEAVNGNLAVVAADHVLGAARDGDGVAISVVRDTAKYLGMAAANLVAIADPDVLVLGGIMSSAADLLLEPVRAELARRLPPAMMQSLAVRPALLGSDASAIGAAHLARSAPQ